jgi:hypothetical protein
MLTLFGALAVTFIAAPVEIGARNISRLERGFAPT